MRPGWPPPESFPARGVAAPNGMPSPCWLYSVSGPSGEPLLVAQLDPREVQDTVLHRRRDLLAASGTLALVERGHDAKAKMQARSAVAHLGTGHEGRTVVEAGGRCRSAGALGHVFVDLAVLVLAGAKSLDRCEDDARVDFLDSLPGKAHAVKRSGCEVLDHHVTDLDESGQDLPAGLVLRVELDRTLVVVEHREIQAVGSGHVHQLLPGRVAHARTLDLDHVRPEPCKKLGAGRAGLDMGEVQNP